MQLTEQNIQIAVSDPLASGWEPAVEQATQRAVVKVIAVPEEIERFRAEFYSITHSVDSANYRNNVGTHSGNGELSANNFEQLVELGRGDTNDEHIVKIVDWLLQYAFEQRASDIHIEPRRDSAQIRFRIDGLLHPVYQLPVQVGQAVVSRVKIIGRMNIAEKRKPLDGRVKTKTLDGQEIELRLSTLPTAFGEKLVMRIFDPEVLVKSFNALGLSDEHLSNWHQMTRQPSGIVLLTGPTGSGKTTTLYSTLKSLATPQINVCTVEDPIEMVEPAFNQMQVQSSIELNFSEGIRALLRQDPDIIMIGEIRDLETAQMATQAALTGHLVLSTVHTTDAPSAVIRLLDLGVPSYLIKSTLQGVMAQRLVRLLCPHCKMEAEVNESVWQQLVRPWSAKVPAKIYQPNGCPECKNTGYLGRTGVYESLLIDDALAEQIYDKADPKTLRKKAIQAGMQSLRLSGAKKVAAGLTTIEEILRVTPDVR